LLHVSVCYKSLISQLFLEGSKQMETIGPHSTSGTRDLLRYSLWELTDHPPYTPHLAQNDFYPLRSVPYEKPGW
jgi:hypothetical protein